MAGRLNSVGLRYKNATKLNNFTDLLTPETKQVLGAHGASVVAPTAHPPAIQALLDKYPSQ